MAIMVEIRFVVVLFCALVSQACGDSCDSHPCLHNGKCYVNEPPDFFGCECVAGFYGDHCQYGRDICSEVKCRNGTCQGYTPDFNGPPAFFCHCQPYNFGDHCQYDDACSFGQKNLCKNGECYNTGFSYECLCALGFYGLFCEYGQDPCKDNPCLNDGTCSTDSSGRHCKCTSNYTGNLCQYGVKNDTCDLKGCLNGGSCPGKGSFCQCSVHYYGSHCQYENKQCKSSPCLNGGLCEAHWNNTFVCNCEGIHYGSYCENGRKDPCSETKCLHNGTCRDFGDRSAQPYMCDCPPGFYGWNCEFGRDLCDDKPCLNGGTCTQEKTGYSCQCPKNYIGAHCENALNGGYLCSEHPCKNGGTCYGQGHYYKCICPQKFYGAECEFHH